MATLLADQQTPLQELIDEQNKSLKEFLLTPQKSKNRNSFREATRQTTIKMAKLLITEHALPPPTKYAETILQLQSIIIVPVKLSRKETDNNILSEILRRTTLCVADIYDISCNNVTSSPAQLLFVHVLCGNERDGHLKLETPQPLTIMLVDDELVSKGQGIQHPQIYARAREHLVAAFNLVLKSGMDMVALYGKYDELKESITTANKVPVSEEEEEEKEEEEKEEEKEEKEKEEEKDSSIDTCTTYVVDLHFFGLWGVGRSGENGRKGKKLSQTMEERVERADSLVRDAHARCSHPLQIHVMIHANNFGRSGQLGDRLLQ